VGGDDARPAVETQSSHEKVGHGDPRFLWVAPLVSNTTVWTFSTAAR
jgi:hypothetical protein